MVLTATGALLATGTAADGRVQGAVDPAVFQAKVLARAEKWFRAGLNYSQDHCWSEQTGYSQANWGGPLGGCSWPAYRTDCSGFVSMAWGVWSSYATPRPGPSPDLDNISHVITEDELRTGDILVADSKHVRLFERWVDRTARRYLAYDFGSTPVKHQEYVLDAPGENRYRTLRSNQVAT